MNTFGIGQEYEQMAAKLFAAMGNQVIPMSMFINNTGGKCAAPMIVDADGLTISPDLLVIGKGKPPFWAEIKQKSIPSYFFKKHRWEHGIDSYMAESYKKIQDESGYCVYILVYEEKSPKTPNLYLDLRQDTSAKKIAENDLEKSGLWMAISLTHAAEKGEVRPNNDAMKKPHNPEGLGLYWPRLEMKQCFSGVAA